MFWLVAASLFFYGWWNPAYLGLICTSIIVNYFIGVSISRSNVDGNESLSFRFLVLGLGFNLLLLGFFKYSYFLVSSANDVFGLEWNLYNVILPIGISFFTLQQIAYLVDTRRNKTSEHNFLQYSLFVVFFPQLIAGPIVHHKQMLPQFFNMETYRPAYRNIAIGMSIFSIGLFKKVVLADNLALSATPIFDMAETAQAISFFDAWTATLAYSLQLYFDFSGYSDMAIGLARIFGIVIPLNFYSPYKATSVIDFWKRWHMTLSSFLRDYVYIPLGGNKKGSSRRQINIMLTMLVGGLWHGAAWTFIAWGALHGFYIIVNHGWRKFRGASVDSWWRVLISRSVTFVFISLAWVLFRAESFDAALEIYKGLIDMSSIFIENPPAQHTELRYFYGYYINVASIKLLLLLLFGVFVLWFLPNTHNMFAEHQVKSHQALINNRLAELTKIERLFLWNPTFLWSMFISILFIVSFMNLTEVSEFLYFQF